MTSATNPFAAADLWLRAGPDVVADGIDDPEGRQVRVIALDRPGGDELLLGIVVDDGDPWVTVGERPGHVRPGTMVVAGLVYVDDGDDLSARAVDLAARVLSGQHELTPEPATLLDALVWAQLDDQAEAAQRARLVREG